MRMKLTYFSPSVFPEQKSHAIQILQTCHAFARAGVKVELFAKKLRGSEAEILAYYGLKPHPNLTLRRPGRAGSKRNAWSGRAFYTWLLARLLRDGLAARLGGERTCYYFRGASRVLGLLRWLAPWARRAGIPLVYEVHSIQYADDVHLRRYVARLQGLKPENAPEFPADLLEKHRRELFEMERDAYASLTGMVTISDRLVELVREHFALERPHLVAPSGVPLEATALPPRAGRDVDLCYVGNLYYFNGVTVLLEALAQMPGRRLAIVGGGEPGDVERCRELAVTLGIADRVEFLGFRPHPEALAWLRRSRVVVAPMLQGVLKRVEDYCSPGKLGEYMASGATIVASRIQSLEVFLKDGRNALLVPPNDAAGLATGLRRALDDEALAAGLAAQAFEDVQPFTFDSRARRLIEFMRTLER
jgi:glycosyltransferase involved in cell wall biosynthesis